MSTHTWHVDGALLQQYAQDRLGLAAAASVETHLTACERCRAVVGREVPTPAAGDVWQRVRAEIAAPPESAALRALRRLGLRDADAVVLRASGGLYLPWALAVAGAIGFAVAAATAGESRGRMLLLLVAPLLPSLAVVAAYDSTDPVREIVETTSASKVRLALLRTLVALVGSVPPLLVVGLLVTGGGLDFLVWVLPALALTSIALVLLTWWSARATAGVLVAGWVAVCTAAGARDVVAGIGHPSTQAVALLVSVAAVAVLVQRLQPGTLGGAS
jgi:hypothetical protein